jgi:hypothetical protein
MGALVMKAQSPTFNRNEMLKIYCICREAERSSDNCFSKDSVWTRFVAYYNDSKRSDLRQIINRIACETLQGEPTPNRASFFCSDFLTFLSLIGHLALNQVSTHYRFSRKEALFVCDSFRRLLAHLQSAKPPSQETMNELRMDFYKCGEIMQHKLVGVQQAKKARNIEHFDQSQFITHVSLADVLNE